MLCSVLALHSNVLVMAVRLLSQSFYRDALGSRRSLELFKSSRIRFAWREEVDVVIRAVLADRQALEGRLRCSTILSLES